MSFIKWGGIATLIAIVCYFIEVGVVSPNRELASLPEPPGEGDHEDKKEVVRAMGQYLEKNPTQVLTPRQEEKPREGSEPARIVFESPVNADLLSAIASEGLRRRLSEFDPKDAYDLNMDVRDYLAQLDQNRLEERAKLLRVEYWLEGNYPTETGPKYFLGLSEEFRNSKTPAADDLAQMTFAFYMDLEKDPQERYKNYSKLTQPDPTQ